MLAQAGGLSKQLPLLENPRRCRKPSCGKGRETWTTAPCSTRSGGARALDWEGFAVAPEQFSMTDGEGATAATGGIATRYLRTGRRRATPGPWRIYSSSARPARKFRMEDVLRVAGVFAVLVAMPSLRHRHRPIPREFAVATKGIAYEEKWSHSCRRRGAPVPTRAYRGC